MHDLFHRYVVKVWKELDFSNGKYKVVNKIVARMCIKYYVKYQKYRNKYIHDEKK